MRNPLLFVTLLLVAACKQPTKAEQPDSRTAPTVGRVESVWEVLDKDTRERVGFVERYRYDDGRMIYWVKSTSRRVKRGYITPNNNAYQYVWIAGQRTEKTRYLGADTIVANSRRILGHDRPVVLEKTSLDALLAELNPAPAPQATADGGEDEE